MMETIDFDAKKIIQNDKRLFIPQYSAVEKEEKLSLSKRMKGLVLLGYKKRYEPNDYDVKRCLLRWYSHTKTQKLSQQAIDLILIQQPICQQTFFYRIKKYCKQNKQQKQKQKEKEKEKFEPQKIQTGQTLRQNRMQNGKRSSAKQKQFFQDPKGENIMMKNGKRIQTSEAKQQDPKLQINKIKVDNSIFKQNSLSKGHLRSISQQLQIPLSSQLDLSQLDIIQTLDHKICQLNKRFQKISFQTCQLIIKKFSYNKERSEKPTQAQP